MKHLLFMLMDQLMDQPDSLKKLNISSEFLKICPNHVMFR